MKDFFNAQMPLFLFPLFMMVGFVFGLLWSKYNN